ncbi:MULTISPECIES: glycosyltransferase family 2 protein [Burkholderia]|uniref:glycosyltransferase family 2 protein n=1 Tax=Burkholderia TaxID=32008 RepID=UPI00075B3115|nr:MULTISPECIES: glycosyltransferase family 2 protein [Burkholderia]KVH13512.1 bactoprenol glucosyl transferase [Burkholderia anthina]KVH14144.1 bactoprenol glucosyl transferase [Burkholderia anthina]KVM85005.1 bactoprenol glucosyl transferase [Burkholderia anthina]KVX32289.1 bactoprenol glucosyl transferase [Burkholderia anthina]MCA8103661.1 glycosyltransferase family 2 protein [Burkholderia sp. AU36459]
MSTHARKPLISLVVPFHDEEETIDAFFAETLPVLESVGSVRFEIVCINDGSRDGTLDRLLSVAAGDGRVHVVDLTRRFGKEAALTAGIDEAAGAAVILIDADLQDPPALIPAMLERWHAGAEVVAAKRTDRMCDPLMQRVAASLYYRVHNRLSEVEMPENVGDFRLMDREVVDALRALPERRRFMKGLFAWVGFRTEIVEYARAPRSGGRSKFSGWRRWNFALEGITSFSTVPLRVWTYVGLAFAALSFVYGAYIVMRTLLYGNPVHGYPSLISVVLFVGGIQLIGIGVIGEYLGRIYHESKQRPVYLVRRRYRAERDAAARPASKLLQFPLKRTHPARRRAATPAAAGIAARKASFK